MTIKDIARECGCAVSTVSRVLNNHPDVKEETKEKVQRVIAERGFVPNGNAKKLKQQETNSILVIVKGAQNLLFANMVELLQHEILGYDFFSVIQYLGENEDEVQSAIALIQEIKPRALAFLGGNADNFEAMFQAISLPAITITTDTSRLSYENLMSVSTDDRTGGRAAIEYLLQMGHREIGILSGDVDNSNAAKLRMQGCAEAFAQAGIVFDPQKQCATTRFNYEPAYLATQKLLNQFPQMTALFAMSDVMAFGAVSAITDRGLQVPGNVSVMGYDGIELARYYYPKITTLRQPQEEMVHTAVKKLMDAMNYGVKPYHRLFETELQPGGSVCRHG